MHRAEMMRMAIMMALFAAVGLSGFYTGGNCYQETANASTLCGGTAAGGYAFASNSWISEPYGYPVNELLYDGDWSSRGYADSVSDFYATYAIPPTTTSAVWTFKDVGGVHNATIPAACMESANLSLRVYGAYGTLGYYCLNSSAVWHGIASSGDAYLYEEAVWWSMPSVYHCEGLECVSTWTEPNFMRRTQIDVQTAASEVHDYMLKLNITYKASMQPDFSDLRFYWINKSAPDGQIKIGYWLASKTDGESATVWARLPNVSGDQRLLMYYLNSSAVSSESDALIKNGTACSGSVISVSTETADSVYQGYGTSVFSVVGGGSQQWVSGESASTHWIKGGYATAQDVCRIDVYVDNTYQTTTNIQWESPDDTVFYNMTPNTASGNWTGENNSFYPYTELSSIRILRDSSWSTGGRPGLFVIDGILSYGTVDISPTFNFMAEESQTNPSLLVTLRYPDDAAVNATNNIFFAFMVTADEQIANCSLIIDNIVNMTSSTITKNVTMRFNRTGLENATYSWKVACTGETFTNSSQTRTLTIAVPHPFTTCYEASPWYSLLVVASKKAYANGDDVLITTYGHGNYSLFTAEGDLLDSATDTNNVTVHHYIAQNAGGYYAVFSCGTEDIETFTIGEGGAFNWTPVIAVAVAFVALLAIIMLSRR